ncbi:MAG: hypothetical protein ABI183_09640 [Polyangiaceae bacterium]
MRSSILVLLFVAAVPASIVIACDDKKNPDVLDTGAPLASSLDAGNTTRDAAITFDASMPERPVPKSSPTVGIYAPLETQQKAISYMAAMAAPHSDDPFVDDDYVKSFAAKMKPVIASMDKGSGAEKAKLERIDIIGGGRRVDLLFALGCEAETPGHAVGGAGITLSTLHDHGVLVVACHDARAQCLQSTRDTTDILCTVAPRHK